MDRMSASFISNFISQKVSEKYKMDSSQVIFLSTFIGAFLAQLDIWAAISFLSEYKVCVFVLSMIIVYLWYTYQASEKEKLETHAVTKIFGSDHYALIRFMMTTHPEFWDKGYNMEINNPFYPTIGKYFTPQENTIVNFNDTIHGVKGYITIRCVNPPEQNRDDKNTEKSVRCLDLCLEKGTMGGDAYLKKLEVYRDSVLQRDKNLTLYMIKVMTPQDEDEDLKNHKVVMYDGPKDNQEKRYKDYMLSYFSENREKLWTYFSNIHFYPEKFRKFGQEARANMLLYGPPGTGKSAFAYRLAMSLGRHIVSVDLTAISNNKAQVYQIIQSAVIDGVRRKPDEYIVLLEEFDIAVMYLHNKKTQKPSFDLSYYYQQQQQDKKGVASSFDRSREFELEDLLEILQGPVPIPGSIILATTNKYEEMAKLCPALFRPGRLTPVEFGNMSWNSLQEMTKHYFGKELSITPVERICIPTSDIVENALGFSLYGEEGFGMFEAFLKKKTSMSF